MTAFYATIVSTYFCSIFSRVADEKNRKVFSIFFIALVSIILVLISGARNDIGDTVFYKHSYDLLVQNPNSFKFDGDFALNLLSLLLINVSTNPQILIFVVALITNILNVIVFYKYRSYLELQIYIYITSGYYIITMNGIRQCLAASLLFLCTKFIVNGEFKKYAISVLLISTIHQSAIVMIPLYFIFRSKAWSKTTFIMIFFALIGAVFFNKTMEIFYSLIKNSNYAQYQNFNEGGSSFMRTIVNSVPVILAYLTRDKLKKKCPESDILVNISLINLFFVAFGMFNWIFNRFTLYLQLYNFILIPYIIKNCLKGKERRLVYIGFLMCYFIFFFREQVIGQNMQYTSEYLDFNKIFYKSVGVE